jgi:hypothetical protein
VYPKVSGFVAWSENCKWNSPFSPGAVAVSFAAITLCVASQRVSIVVVVVVVVHFVIDSV